LAEAGFPQDILVQTGIGKPAAGDSWLDFMATISLHWKCPITPDRTPAADTLGYVEESMEWEGAGGKPLGVILIIYP
jgi:hypothetical protein